MNNTLEVRYSMSKEIDEQQLEALFASVNWSSAAYPERLAVAMKNSDRVVTAWCDGTLVGLMNALSDGAMTAYFHYVLVRPEYHGHGIGRAMVGMMLDHYAGYLRKVLVSYDDGIDFYKDCGFTVSRGKTPMFVTSLTT